MFTVEFENLPGFIHASIGATTLRGEERLWEPQGAAARGQVVGPMEAPPHSAWARRADLVVATSPDFAAHQNMRASAEWDASSPCADHMQTDSPSNMKTPVPEGRHGMEVCAPLAVQGARALCGAQARRA